MNDVDAALRIAVCLKWVAPAGEPGDERFSGTSPADESALEWALRQADDVRGHGRTADVTVVTVGPRGADRIVRDSLARGADHGARVEAPTGLDSADVAAALGLVVTGCAWVWCGDHSADRGTGSVPAFLAHALGAQQALGCVHAEFGDDVRLTRRLDGGRREILAATAPAVVSVEGATAPLRRASLPAVRLAASRSIEVRPVSIPLTIHDAVTVPYRPRARVLTAPSGDAALDRLRVLTASVGTSAARSESIATTPADAAARILSAVRAWGYLE